MLVPCCPGNYLPLTLYATAFGMAFTLTWNAGTQKWVGTSTGCGELFGEQNVVTATFWCPDAGVGGFYCNVIGTLFGNAGGTLPNPLTCDPLYADFTLTTNTFGECTTDPDPAHMIVFA